MTASSTTANEIEMLIANVMRRRFFPGGLAGSAAGEAAWGGSPAGADTLASSEKRLRRSAAAFSLGRESSLLVRTQVTAEAPQLGEITQTTDFLDYREVDGINIPFAIRTTNPAQTVSATVTTVEHNVALDESLFVKPAN